MLKDMDENADFFLSLARLDKGFTGSLHCEACLASLIVPNSDHTGNSTVVDSIVGGHLHLLDWFLILSYCTGV